MLNKELFLIERYKYILSRKQSLNETTFKVAAIYQVVIIALAIAQFNIIQMRSAHTITFIESQFYTNCLMIMLTILTFLIISLLLGGVFAWLKYRKEESNIEFEAFGQSRGLAKFSNIFRWYETYIAIIVIIVYISALWAYFKILAPMLIAL